MQVYYFLICTILVVYIFLNKFVQRFGILQEKRDKFFLMIVWIALSFVAGMRAYSVGSDSLTYATMFQKEYVSNFEIGYVSICKLLWLFTNNPTVLFWICALLTNGLVLIVIYKKSRYIPLSVFTYIGMYFYFNSFNAMRQYIAVSLVFFAYMYLVDDKQIKYWLLIILASTFHKTAILAGVMLFFLIQFKNNSIYNKIKFQVISITGVFIWLFLDKIILIFVRMFPKYEFYLEQGSKYLVNKGGIQEIIVYILLFILGMLFLPRVKVETNSFHLLMFVMAVLSFISLK